MVHGGTSGIGLCAIQLAKAFGATVMTTAGSPEKTAFCLKMGADHAIDYRQQDFAEEVKRITNKRGVDVILDMVGGDYVERNLKCLALEGRLAQIAFLKGSRVECDLRFMMLKRLTLTGSTLRPRSREVKAGFARALEAQVWPLLAAGKVKVVMDSTFPLAEAAAAHRRLETSQHIGKVVLTV
jgi:NADPH2:quinone reductase